MKTKNRVKIPKRFQLFSQTIEVVTMEDLSFEEMALGRYAPRMNRIELQLSTKGHPVNEELAEQVWFHELTHAILDKLNYSRLYEDEQFVDQFAHCLHQAFRSAEYDDK